MRRSARSALRRVAGARRARAAAPPPDPGAGHPFEDLAAADHRDELLMRRLIAWNLYPDSSCVDVGAHQGAVLGEILRAAPQGRHIAYEPLPHLAEKLSQDFPQVEVRNAALADRAGPRPRSRTSAPPRAGAG